MPVTLHRREITWLMRLEGRITVTSAAELKEALLEWLAAGKNLELDLETAEEIDVTVMQLLWATARAAAPTGMKIVARMSRAAAVDARDGGFTGLPGFPVPE
jgi:anti-anti-sigma regulatory factor